MSTGPQVCPDPEVLGSFLDGKLTGASLAEVSSHVKTCSDCLFVLGEANRFVQEETESEEEPPRTGAARAWWLAAAAALALAGGAAFWQLSRSDPARRMAAAARYTAVRPIEGRLTDFPHARFRAPRAVDAASAEGAELRAIAHAVLTDRGAGGTADDLLARGVASMIIGEPDRAVELLARAARQSPSNARYWSDLAAARIALARQTGDASQLQLAIADANRALATDGDDVAALFNRALARERLGLHVEAAADYRRLAGLEPGSAWAEEAAARASSLRY